jgi:hypothetical protein
MKNWKVLLKGVLWSDWLDSEEAAKKEIEDGIYLEYGKLEDFTISEMTKEDIDSYDLGE